MTTAIKNLEIGNAPPFARSPAHPLIWLAVVVLALALALLPLQIVLALVGGAAAVALALAEPVFGLYFAVLSVPVQEAWHLPGGLSYTQAAMALAAGAWGLRVLAQPRRRIVGGPLLLPWCLLLWALLLSTACTPYATSLALKETLRWAEAFVVWLLAVNTVQKRWQVFGLVACVLLAPASEAVLGLWQFATGDGPPSFQIAASLPFVRAYGNHGQPNSFAGYMNMAWPLALALLLSQLKRGDKGQGTRDKGQGTGDRPSIFASAPRYLVPFVVLLVLLVLLGALGASFSRGAWVGALVGLLGMALTLGRRARYAVLTALALLGLALTAGGAGLLPGALASRIASIAGSFTYFDPSNIPITPANFAVVERMAHIQAGLRMFAAHPLTGVGPGNFSAAYQDVAVAPWYVSRGHAHNYYLHMAAEAGLVGLLAYLLLIGSVAHQAITLVRRTSSPFWRSIAVGCCGIIACVAGHNLFENLHALSMGIQLAAVWALVTLPRDER